MKTITITKTIPAPPDGWEYQDRKPEIGEPFWFVNANMKWEDRVGQNADVREGIYAYRIRDEYAEKYEALKLPDGWAFIDRYDCLTWVYTKSWGTINAPGNRTLRRIINGKAYRIGEEPK